MKRLITFLSCLLLIIVYCPKVSALSDDVVQHLKVDWIIQDNGFIRVNETYTVETYNQIYEKNFIVQIPKNKQVSWEDIREEVYVPVTNVVVETNQKYRIKNTDDAYTIVFEKSNLDEEYTIRYLVKAELLAHNDTYYLFSFFLLFNFVCYVINMYILGIGGHLKYIYHSQVNAY